MRLYRNIFLFPKYITSPVLGLANKQQEQFHSAARLLIRIEPFKNCIAGAGNSGVNNVGGPMTKIQAIEVVKGLSGKERDALREALNQYDSDRFMLQLEEDRVGTKWSSRVNVRTTGTPQPATAYINNDNTQPGGVVGGGGDGGGGVTVNSTKISSTSSSSVSPLASGTVKLAGTFGAANTAAVSKDDLMKLMLVHSVPFLGFGFLDNFFMIIAGDYIEHSLGMFMCISTMAAAGLGNTISDVLGLGLAHYVEQFCTFLGLRPPQLSPEQLDSPKSKRACGIGRALGITVGCILGMCPLWFKSKKPKENTQTTTTADVVAVVQPTI